MRRIQRRRFNGMIPVEAITAILRAAHCKSTHHYFAIDSLEGVKSNRGKSLANLLLTYFGDYLKGAKDPDNVFKDFENHVLHVTDGYWGGAAKAAQRWHATTHKLLNDCMWREAAYSMGVLSHYFTDPFMPLHTAQSERESIVHRPLEWSVCCAYSDIFDAAYIDTQVESFKINSDKNWIHEAVVRGATLANQFYDCLIDDYQMKLAKENPQQALGADSKKALSKIFVWVVTGWGAAIEQIANESYAMLPYCSLTLPTLLAGVQMPIKKIIGKVHGIHQQQEVARILDEFKRTGKVVQSANLEQIVVRQKRELPADSKLNVAPVQLLEKSGIQSVPLLDPKHRSRSEKDHDADGSIPSENVAVEQDRIRTTSIPTTNHGRLIRTSPIVDAPAIGPKTASRLQGIGVITVGDFLDREPQAMADQLGTTWITPRLVSQWQCQAQMSCEIDRLTAVGSGLLVLGGIHSTNELVRHSAARIHAIMHGMADTAEGKSVLRNQLPPTIETIENWIASIEPSGSPPARG